MGQLDGKIAVITGSTRGLGLATARAYLREGASVIISSRTALAVEAALAGLKSESAPVSGLACDVGDLAQVQALADHALAAFGGFDIWINNAGIAGPYGPTAAVPIADYRAVVETNILGTYYGSVVALRHFIPRGRGKLINLLGRGDHGPVAFQNTYAPSKAWVKSFTLALAKENKALSAISIFAFNPGLVETDMMSSPRAIAGYEARVKPLATVMRMWGQPPEIPAERAVWLASAATDGQTGKVVSMLSPRKVIGGALGELGRRLTRRAASERPLQVATVPPEFDVKITPDN